LCSGRGGSGGGSVLLSVCWRSRAGSDPIVPSRALLEGALWLAAAGGADWRRQGG